MLNIKDLESVVFFSVDACEKDEDVKQEKLSGEEDELVSTKTRMDVLTADAMLSMPSPNTPTSHTENKTFLQGIQQQQPNSGAKTSDQAKTVQPGGC